MTSLLDGAVRVGKHVVLRPRTELFARVATIGAAPASSLRTRRFSVAHARPLTFQRLTSWARHDDAPWFVDLLTLPQVDAAGTRFPSRCGIVFDGVDGISLDHVVARSTGYGHTLDDAVRLRIAARMLRSVAHGAGGRAFPDERRVIVGWSGAVMSVANVPYSYLNALGVRAGRDADAAARTTWSTALRTVRNLLKPLPNEVKRAADDVDDITSMHDLAPTLEHLAERLDAFVADADRAQADVALTSLARELFPEEAKRAADEAEELAIVGDDVLRAVPEGVPPST